MEAGKSHSSIQGAMAQLQQIPKGGCDFILLGAAQKGHVYPELALPLVNRPARIRHMARGSPPHCIPRLLDKRKPEDGEWRAVHNSKPIQPKSEGSHGPGTRLDSSTSPSAVLAHAGQKLKEVGLFSSSPRRGGHPGNKEQQRVKNKWNFIRASVPMNNSAFLQGCQPRNLVT